MNFGGREKLGESLTANGYKFGSILAQLTPGPVAQSLSQFAGVAASPALKDKREIFGRHLLRVDPTMSPAARKRKTQQAFESYARYWVESFRLPSLSSATVERGFEVDGYPHILEGLEAGNGVILALPHLGGWEWAGRWMTDQGHKMTVVVEPLENTELFEWFAELRAKLGMTVVPLGPDAGPTVLRSAAGQRGGCLLCDRDLQHSGIEVEFFGERTTLPAGPATLALRTGAALARPGSISRSATTGTTAWCWRRRGSSGPRSRADITELTQPSPTSSKY
ncbi:MAG: hypothetical protein R2715_08900 [Ilumatobacteraceae bacterium]